MSKWVIVGWYENIGHEYGGYTGESDWIENNVATFDYEAEAKEYVKKSKLKSPKDRNRPFRSKSLLSSYSYVEIDKYIPEELPHNPTL